MPRVEDEQDFSVVRWGEMEVIHGLVPDCDLSAGHVASDGPVVRLAFHENCGIFASKIESMALRFSGCVAKVHRK